MASSRTICDLVCLEVMYFLLCITMFFKLACRYLKILQLLNVVKIHHVVVSNALTLIFEELEILFQGFLSESCAFWLSF